METEILKLCGAAICALSALLVLRSQKSEFAGYVGIAAAVLLLGAAAGKFLPAIAGVGDMLAETGFRDYAATLTKALGVTLAVQLTSEICRDAGEAALASKLELVGKAELLVLSLPLIRELSELAARILDT